MSRAPVGDVLRTCAHTDPIGTEADAEALARRLYRLACPSALPLTFRWSDKATRAFGTASFRNGRAVLMVSREIWRIAPESERREVIAHEVAHLVVFAEYFARPFPRGRIEPSHGHQWRTAMVRFGFPYHVSTKHTLHVPSKRPDSLEIKCACMTTSITLGRIARCPIGMACRRCRAPYVVVTAHGLLAWKLARGRLQLRSNAQAEHPEAALWRQLVTRAPDLDRAPDRVLMTIAEELHAQAPIAACEDGVVLRFRAEQVKS